MSNAPDPTPPAPLPWLGNPQSPPNRQSWSSRAAGGWMLRVGFAYNGAWQRRCLWHLFWMRVPHALVGWAITYASTVAGVLGAKLISRGVNLSTLLYVLQMSVPVAVLITFFKLINSFFDVRQAKGASGLSVVVTANSVLLTGLRKPFAVGWSRIARIVYRDGDIFVLPKLLGSEPFAIARTAFVNTDAANRFHLALVALQQSHGNAGAIPAEVLADFAPQPDAPAPV